MSEIYKIPFLRLLLPLLAGIILQYYLWIEKWSIVIASLGIIIILFSFFIPKNKQYSNRWIFGSGLYMILISIGIFLTWIKQYQNAFPFSEAHQVYTGYISDIPQTKPNTIAVEVELNDYGRKIVCYFPKDSLASTLEAGNEISFLAQIKPFEKVGKIGNFDYANYMFNKGYCGYTFVQEDLWEKTNKDKWSLAIEASRARKKILDFYNDLKLNNDETALLSALTLGYKTNLSDDVVQDFRNSGIAHILAVSGLHVGIIYMIILSILKKLGHRKSKQLVIIGFLWIYIFIVGLPPSAVRAGIMLTLFCISIMLNRKAYSYNSIFVAAFFILVWNPLLFFDLGFQLSFVAILSIKLFMPSLVTIFRFKNKIAYKIWSLLCLSFAAQLGILPLSLYYFGYFPLYFLLVNLFIIPILSIIIYLTLAISVLYYLSFLWKYLFLKAIDFLVYCLKCLLDYILSISHFFAETPYSTIQNLDISSISVFLIWFFIISIYLLVKKVNAVRLISLLTLCLLILTVSIYNRYSTHDTFTVYKNPNEIKMIYQNNMTKVILSDTDKNRIYDINGQNFLLMVDNEYSSKITNQHKMMIDYLYIETDKTISILELSTLFDIKKIILGNRVSQKTVKRLKQECEKTRIPYYDVYLSGNLTINF